MSAVNVLPWRLTYVASKQLGVEEPIRIDRYDAGWPARFEAERAVLADAIGQWAIGSIHHVGSTAVPALDAKPVIDILVGVADQGDCVSYVETGGKNEPGKNNPKPPPS